MQTSNHFEGHDAWTWQQVADLALSRDPRNLARAILSRIKARYSDKTSRYERWADEEVGQILEACVDADPSLAGELLELWDAHPEFVESLASRTFVQHVGANTLGEWASTERRQIALAKMIPAAHTPITFALLERFGPTGAFARRLRDGLFPRSWSGSLSEILDATAKQVLEWASDSSAPRSFQRWARDTADVLKKATEKEKLRELEEE